MKRTYQSIRINAPVEKVWNAVKDFHDLSWAPNVITKCEAVGDKGGTEIGAKRILNDAFHEALIELDDATHTMRYSIDNGPSPVSQEDVKKSATTSRAGGMRIAPRRGLGHALLVVADL